MENLPLEVKGMIFSYLDTEQILDYMQLSEKHCTEIKKFSKYIELEECVVINMHDILYFTDMKIKKLYIGYHICHEVTNEKLKLIVMSIKRIEYLDLRCCHQICDDGLKYLKNIQIIDIHHCNKITDDGLEYLQNVNKIIIYGNKLITNAGLKHLTNIYYVGLLTCRNINDEGLEYLENVHTIYLEYMQNITDNGIKKLKNVRYLLLGSLGNISDVCFEYLGNVEVLYISGISSLTDKGLKYLSNINFLKVNSCENITVKGINKLLEKRPGLIWSIDNVGNNGSDEMNFFDKVYI
jgi:hypothetical protein